MFNPYSHDFTNNSAVVMGIAGSTIAGLTDVKPCASIVAAVVGSGFTPTIPGHLQLSAVDASTSYQTCHLSLNSTTFVNGCTIEDFVWQTGDGFKVLNFRVQGAGFGGGGSAKWYSCQIGGGASPAIAVFNLSSGGTVISGTLTPTAGQSGTYMLAFSPNQRYRVRIYCINNVPNTQVQILIYLTAIDGNGVEIPEILMWSKVLDTSGSRIITAGYSSIGTNSGPTSVVALNFYNLTPTATGTVSSDNYQVVSPDGLLSTTPCSIVLQYHGANGDETQYTSLAELAAVTVELVRNGYVCLCQNLGGDHWNNNAAQALVPLAVTAIKSLYNPTKLYQYGASMGGGFACIMMVNNANISSIPIIATWLNSPASSTTYMHDVAGFATPINTSYGGSTQWTAAAPTHDPQLMLQNSTGTFRNIPTRIVAARDDTIVNPVNNADILNKYALPIPLVRNSFAGHVSAMTTSPKYLLDMLSFFANPLISSGGSGFNLGGMRVGL